MKQYSLKNPKGKPTCPCGYDGKIKAAIIFGYLNLKCPNCKREIISEGRSGSETYHLNTEMLKRWNDPTEGEYSTEQWERKENE